MDELDERLKALTEEYHEPPPLDRDAVWARIAARRQAPTVVSWESWVARRVARRALRWAAGIAAILAIGFVLGRSTQGARPTPHASRLTTPASRLTTPTALTIAAASHIRQAETYLTLFRASVQGGEPDAAAIPAARELLATNRLLASAPHADPRMQQLLLDLELVLVQITQLEGSQRPEDVRIITDGLDRAGTLTRLRTAAPRYPASLSIGVS